MGIDLEIAAWWWEVHLGATWALVGLIWTVQVAVYPQFAVVKPAEFTRWHASYTRRIGGVVGPLMAVEMVTGVAWVWWQPASGWAWSGLGLIGVNWLSTAVVQVPQHRRLGEKYDARVIAALGRGNWVRTVAWSLRGVVVLAVGGG